MTRRSTRRTARRWCGWAGFGEARTILEPLLTQAQDDPYLWIAVARARLGSGDAAGGRDALARAESLWRAGKAPALGTLAYNIGAAWAVVPDADTALQWLLRARDQYGIDGLDLRLDPDLDTLRRAGSLEALRRR